MLESRKSKNSCQLRGSQLRDVRESDMTVCPVVENGAW